MRTLRPRKASAKTKAKTKKAAPKSKAKPQAKAKVKAKAPANDWVYEHLPVRTEEEQFRGLPEHLWDAWERFKETLQGFGEQRIYTSHKAIMFARTRCYAFVRPKKKFLEVTFFLPRKITSPQFKKVAATSKTRFGYVLHLQHRDEVEGPIAEWLREAFTESSI